MLTFLRFVFDEKVYLFSKLNPLLQKFSANLSFIHARHVCFVDMEMFG